MKEQHNTEMKKVSILSESVLENEKSIRQPILSHTVWVHRSLWSANRIVLKIAIVTRRKIS